MDTISTSLPITCSACADGKGTQRPQPHTTHHHHNPGDAISSDSVRPFTLPSQLNHRHVLTFVDARTRYEITLPIRNRAELATLNPTNMKHIAQLHGRPPRSFHEENSMDYRS